MHWPEKKDREHLPDHKGETANNSASIETIQILINSVSSTPNSCFGDLDVKIMHLESLLKDPQCMRFKLSQIADEFQQQHKLWKLVKDTR